MCGVLGAAGEAMKAAVLALLCLCLAGSSAAHLSRSGMGHWCFFKSQLQVRRWDLFCRYGCRPARADPPLGRQPLHAHALNGTLVYAALPLYRCITDQEVLMFGTVSTVVRRIGQTCKSMQEGFSCTDHSLIRVVLRVAETAHMFWGPRNEAQGRSGMLHGRSASPRNDGDSSTSNAVEMTIMYSKDIRVGNGNIIAENMVRGSWPLAADRICSLASGSFQTGGFRAAAGP